MNGLEVGLVVGFSLVLMAMIVQRCALNLCGVCIVVAWLARHGLHDCLFGASWLS
jgi:hypothetical protein